MLIFHNLWPSNTTIITPINTPINTRLIHTRAHEYHAQ
jgi:hypothetical protein